VSVEIGVVLREDDLRNDLAALASRIAAAGIDHVTVGDHVSFAGGHGVDGLIQAAALLSAHPRLPVQTGFYLLSLRHPATVARQLATIALLAPGRFEFGIGVGGDDPRELALCGVDPRTRGARTTEALELLRLLLTGERTAFRGRFFAAEGAAIRPAPEPAIPILVGGRSDAALRRAGRLADGWLALWVSPRRFAAATELVDSAALHAGRQPAGWRHTLQLWASFDRSRARAIGRIRPVMRRSYGLPFERFERYTPCGTPHEVAAALEPYLAAGCRRFNLVPEAGGIEAGVDAVGAVKAALS
jgi:alkanesulfonate monooxygenase SsuD/methylene tetrahydromethanopterin reductase-like flavin-dependent oxidoreductase (luciferase family)